MFEQAARMKLRFDTHHGSLSAEDLWDLPLKDSRSPTNLNTIAVALDRQLKRDTVSFVDDEEKADPRLQLAFDIVRHVIAVKKAENKIAAEASQKRAFDQKIMAIIARKEDEVLESKDVDELRRLLNEREAPATA